MLDQWIVELSKELELPDKLPKEAGNYFFPVDDKVSVIISSFERGFAFFCALAPCPSQKCEAFFVQVMLANLFGQGTKGAVLGLIEDYQVLTLLLEVENADSYKEFHDRLEDFLNTVDFWREEAAAAAA